MKIFIHTLVGFSLFSVIGLLLTVIKFIYHHRYGKAVFIISSNKYRKSQKSKKEFTMNVTPFKDENENIYLPLKYVANSLGAKLYYDQNYKFIIKIMDKNIKVNDNSILIENNSISLNRKIEEDVKVVNDELMLPQKYIKDIFEVNIEVDDSTGEVVLK